MRTYTNNVTVHDDSDDMKKVLNLNDIWQLDPLTKWTLIDVSHQMVLLQVNLFFHH
jgi:hypothetical protein